MGGAQAIAALAYGTESGGARGCDRRARQPVRAGGQAPAVGVVGIDGFAGPSDLLVVMGADADARSGGAGSAGPGRARRGRAWWPRSPTRAQALDALAQELERLAGQAPEVEPAVCALVEVPDTRAGIELANAFAPEHLQLIGAEPEALAPLVRTAGCLFVGAGSATAFGDYVAGSNHVLPTGGAARFESGLSARHFRRPDGRGADRRRRARRKLAGAGAPIARAEGFEWHARSMEARAESRRRSGASLAMRNLRATT